MRLSSDEASGRLQHHRHGVLSTLHPERGVDAVPVVYAVVDDRIGIPIDTVKAKSSTRLQRVRNLEFDPRATLLIEHWDADDWSRLWWVRAEMRWEPDPSDETIERLATGLAADSPQYRDRPFEQILVLRLVGVTGWAAEG